MKTAAQIAFYMAVLTLLSKVVGFLREMIIANFFGASYITDSYVMAGAIPGILFGGIFGAIATAYMPLYAKISEEAAVTGEAGTAEKDAGASAGNRFTSETINLLLIVSVLSSIVGIVFSDQLTAIFASGFTGETAKLTSFFLKVSFSFVAFSSVAGILEAYLNYKGSFLSPIIVGYVQNACVILGVVISAYTSHYYLAYGLLLGYAARFLLIAWLASRKNYHYTPIFRPGKTVQNMMALAVPVFIGSSLGQINAFVDRILASGLPEGSVAALNYGNLLLGMVSGLTISILTRILYPKLNQASATQDHERFSEIIASGFTLIFIIALPFSLGAMAFSSEVTQIVYERGAFDPVATAMTGTALFYYAVGLLPASLGSHLVQAYYSLHNTRFPMIVGAVGVVVNVTLNLILIRSMAHGGLALATSIASFVNTILLMAGIKKYYPQVTMIQSGKKLLLICVAAVAAVGTSYLTYRFAILPMATLGGFLASRTLHLILAVVAAGPVYLALLALFRVEELQMLRHLRR